MNRDTIDPRMAMLVASIYGELSSEEEAQLREMLAADAELRAEYEELVGTRALLRAWELDETEAAPRFVMVSSDPFLETERTRPGQRRARRLPPRPTGRTAGVSERLRAVLDRINMPVGWALTGAALVLAILAIADFRIQAIDRGLSFTFGAPEATSLAARSGPNSEGAKATRPHPRVVGLLSEAVVAGNDDSPYLRREDFEMYADRMARVMSDLLSTMETDEERTRDFTGFMRAVYQGLDDRQSKDYYDLRGRIEAVRMNLDEVQVTSDRLDDMFQANPGEPLVPNYSAPGTNREGNRGNREGNIDEH